MHEVLVNRLGGLSLPRKSVVRLTDRPDMTLYVYRGRKTTMQQQKDTALIKYILERSLVSYCGLIGSSSGTGSCLWRENEEENSFN